MMAGGAAVDDDGGCVRQLRLPFFTDRRIKEREERGESEMEKENTMDEYHCHKRQLTFSPIQQSTSGEPELFTLVNVVVVFKGELVCPHHICCSSFVIYLMSSLLSALSNL